MNGKPLRFLHRQRRFKKCFDDVKRWRQNVRNQVVAELDLRIKGTANAQLVEGVTAGQHHGRKPQARENAERDNCRRNRDAHFHFGSPAFKRRARIPRRNPTTNGSLEPEKA